MQIKIVMYHYVRQIQDSKYPNIKGLEISAFKRQIKWFQQRFNFISAKQILNAIYFNELVPNNSISLTFDDGLKDHYSNVFPILKKEKIQGMFFVSGEPLENQVVLYVHKLQFIIEKCPISKILKELMGFIQDNKSKYDLLDFNEYKKKLSTTDPFDDPETVLIKRILQFGLAMNARKQFIDDLFFKYVTKDEKSFSKELYLSMDDIHEMKEGGMYFGSHAYSHEWLEFTHLKNELEKTIRSYSKINPDKNSWMMAYPSGSYNPTVIDEIKKLGFRAGLIFEQKEAILDKDHAFILNRFDTNDFPQ
ncbi:MAG: polysaccharide deacetylase family protein [Nitrosopumilus sp.]|uniref:polysaccharide deacetylase family protein n=1 Tax=Nitrosopumilus sp. TaxID=2024843 RepID=UPI00247B4AAE|nr:polysaccharide deacetylase family protein [Nitrosopumilus sp.]MCV0393568.1 polysaccharide deacetylase family protein [Nitrosopumilus sp.]